MRAYGVYTWVVAYQKSNKWAKRTSEISDTTQQVCTCKHRTKHFPCGIMFVIYILRLNTLLKLWQLALFKQMWSNNNHWKKAAWIVKSERAQINPKLTSRLSTYSSTEESWITKHFSLMAFAETGTFNINDGRNANKNCLLPSDSQSDGLCGVQNRANQPWMKTPTCRTAHLWKNMIRGSWLDVSLSSHVGKAIHDIDWFTSVCEPKFTLRLFSV